MSPRHCNHAFAPRHAPPPAAPEPQHPSAHFIPPSPPSPSDDRLRYWSTVLALPNLTEPRTIASPPVYDHHATPPHQRPTSSRAHPAPNWSTTDDVTTSKKRPLRRATSSRRRALDHVAASSTVPRGGAKCTICFASFMWAKSLRSHVQTVHEKQKNYQCLVCGRRFGTRSNARKHQKEVHEKIKPVFRSKFVS